MALDPLGALPSNREQTNQSLRAERRDIDRLIRDLTHIDETADAAITRSRARSEVGTREAAHRLAHERQATDQGLLHERQQSDEVLKTRDEVLSVVGHDLRNMLLTILGMAELIEGDADPQGGPHSILAYARFIRQAGARMTRLVGDLSDMASIEAGTLAVTEERGDVTTVVLEAVEMFQTAAAERGVTLTLDIESALPNVMFDSARVYQVLTNLLSNAIKFTPKGGTVTVGINRTGDEICFTVADSGIGIPAEQLTAVFGRHVQLSKDDRRGAGIGLYISRSIVRRHGGRIWADSVPGAGSTFCFTLPLSA